jgi:hypothetical protein
MRSADGLYSVLLLCEPLCVVVIRLIVPVRVARCLDRVELQVLHAVVSGMNMPARVA